MAVINWQDRISIWQGLENFRQVALDLLSHDITKVNQATLDKLFSGYEFKLDKSRRDELINAIEEQIKALDPSSELAQNLAAELNNLKELDEEIVIKRSTDAFEYEYVFKGKETQVNLAGFVKVINKSNPKHIGLLSWQHDKRDPILFLVELIGDEVFFHINLGGEDGLVVLAKSDSGYTWTQCLKHDYPDLVNAEYGSVFMDKESKEIKLIDGNIAAATALSKASTVTSQGPTVFENNIKLMEMYKKDLQSLDFNY